jgi:hypothetical protein
MKTAVQKLMDDLKKNQDFSIFNNHHINHYLEIERKQMIDLVKYIFKEVDFNEPHVPYEIVDLYLMPDERKAKSVGKKIF